MAGMIAIIFLLPAPVSAFNTWRKKRLLDDLNVVKSIRELSWKEFEEIVAEIFRRKGYTAIENFDLGPDGGIDVTLKKMGFFTEMHTFVGLRGGNWRGIKSKKEGG